MAGLIEFISPYFKQHGVVLDDCGEEADENLIGLATGRWTGCVDIINAMRGNHMLWAMCWYSSRRGGLHKFII